MKYYFCRMAGVACASLMLALGETERASASAFLYQFNNVFDGERPTGSSPWITTSFTDLSSGVVQLKISASGLSGGESLDSLFLNLDSSDDASKLAFTFVGSSGGFALPAISTGNNKFKADGDGKFDVDLAFSEKSSKTFTAGEYVIYNIMSTSSAFTLDAMDFDAQSKTSGGHGAFLAAAEISGIPASCSGTSTGWIAPCSLTVVPVPEPGTTGILASGAVLLAASRWLSARRVRRS